MKLKSLPLLCCCFHFCLISMLYFLTLVLHIDGRVALLADVLLAVCAGFLLRKKLRNATVTHTYAEILVWLALSGWLLKTALAASSANGGWDAWAMWNLHARFLSDKDNWQLMFDPAMIWNSPDYPLNLPGFIAACWAWLGTCERTIPFLAALFSTLVIPGIVFFERRAYGWLVATGAFLLFLFNGWFIRLGMLQYADVLLGLFYLCSVVCLEKTGTAQEDRLSLFLAGFFCAAAAWTKNEAWLFILPLLAVDARQLLQRHRLGPFLLGLLPPLALLLVFKTFFAPAGYAPSHFSFSLFKNMLDGERYMILFSFMWHMLWEQFPLLLPALAMALVAAIWSRKVPKNFTGILIAFLAYSFIYLYFDFGLEWQLKTSLNRLFLQLEIPFLFIVSGMVGAALKESRIGNLAIFR